MKISISKIIEYIVVVIFALGTGSLYFQVLRMPFMMSLELFSAFFLLFYKKRIDNKNVIIAVLITVFFLISTLLNLSNGFHVNDFIIWIGNVFFIIVLSSNMDFKNFKTKFVKIMIIEALVSLVCYLFADILAFNILPFLTNESNAGNSYYLTPYFTLGWGNIPVFHRNAGIYWEPGAHQIFLNLALFLLLSDKNKLGLKNRVYYFYIVVLTITVLTTQSTTGYLCYIAVIMAIIFKNNGLRKKWKTQMLLFALLIVAIIIEINTGVVSTKLGDTLNGRGTGNTRFHDTYYGYFLALQNPIIGTGSFSENASNFLLQYKVINISNGMAAFSLQSGILATICFLILIFKGIRDKFKDCGLSSQLMFLFFILVCVNTESIFLNLSILMLIFEWKNSKKIT